MPNWQAKDGRAAECYHKPIQEAPEHHSGESSSTMPHLRGGVDLTRGGQEVRCGRENGKRVEGGQESSLRVSDHQGPGGARQDRCHMMI